jgi:DNA (cytosine-5)-methyltransferase 1
MVEARPKINALSFFSGAMGLDLGLEQAGISMLLACEMDKSCRRTIAANRPDLALLGDIWEYSADDVRKAAGLAVNDEIDVVVGGAPCQAFSTAGARRGFKDERGNALLKYINLISSYGRLEYHNKIYREICNQLGWVYIPTFRRKKKLSK